MHKQATYILTGNWKYYGSVLRSDNLVQPASSRKRWSISQAQGRGLGFQLDEVTSNPMST